MQLHKTMAYRPTGSLRQVPKMVFPHFLSVRIQSPFLRVLRKQQQKSFTRRIGFPVENSIHVLIKTAMHRLISIVYSSDECVQVCV